MFHQRDNGTLFLQDVMTIQRKSLRTRDKKSLSRFALERFIHFRKGFSQQPFQSQHPLVPGQ
jgi:hypothetical protein